MTAGSAPQFDFRCARCGAEVDPTWYFESGGVCGDCMADDDCRCGRIKLGSEVTEHRNWNPDCPVHPWTDAMQARVDRSVELQRQAREARRKARDGI